MTDAVAPNPTKYTVRYTVIVTQDMDDKLELILKRQDRSVSKSDLLRTAIRQYLDEQEDLIGSRRHFSKSLQNRLDQIDGQLIFYLNILIYLLAAGLAVLLQAVTRDSKIQAVNLIRTAISTTLKEGPIL